MDRGDLELSAQPPGRDRLPAAPAPDHHHATRQILRYLFG
jgi:hypothetical protein